MCTKRRFAFKAGALLRIAEIVRKGEVREKQPVRAYYCRECGGYHLTSQDISPQKKQLLARRKKDFPERAAAVWIAKKKWE